MSNTVWKLAVLCFCTFGFYQLYRFCKNWN